MKMTILGILTAWLVLSTQAGIAQTFPASAAGTLEGPNAKAIKAWYSSWFQKDWSALQQTLTDGFTFSSPLDDHISLARMKERCWPNAYNIKRMDLEKVVIDGDNAFVIGTGWNNDGKSFRNCDYFKFKDGKISAYECFFGPGINYPNSEK